MNELVTGPQLTAWEAFLHAHARIISRLDRDLRDRVGMSLSEYDVLTNLAPASEQGMRMSDLATAVVLTRSGLTRLVDRLESAGLVERLSCESDGRVMYARLTVAGQERLAEVRPEHHAGVQQLFAAGLDATDATQLAQLLERLPACTDQAGA